MGSNPSKLQIPDSGDNTAAGSDEYRTSVKHKHYEFVCTTCARNYKHVSASIYCKSCRDHLCFRCLQWHTKYKVDHVDDLIDKDETRKLGVQGSPVMPTEKCLDHDDKLWNMFCQKDVIAGCQQCMDEKHRECKSVIPRSTQHIEATNRQTSDDGQVGGKLRQMSLDDGQVDGRQRKPHQSEDLQVGGKLRQHFADDGQVDGKKRERVYPSDDLQVDPKLKYAQKSKYDDQVTGSKKINERSIQATTSSTDDGQVPGTSRTDVEKQTRHEDDDQVSGTRIQHTSLYSVGSGIDVNVRLKNDTKKCCIYNICVLSDGRILMSDNYNGNLKLLDSNLNMIHHCVVHSIHDICIINDTEAAVAMYPYGIRFVSIKDKMKLGRKIQLDHACCVGLAYSGGELYVSNGYADIHVYTVDGKKLRTIKTGVRWLKEAGGGWLTVSKDGSRIYMTNCGYGIVCVDRLSGKIIWKMVYYNGYCFPDDDGYTGVCIDRYKNVFVCTHVKNDVVQFSPSGQLTGVVITKSEGLERPMCIGIDEVRNRLIVGMDNKDVVKVFDFKL